MQRYNLIQNCQISLRKKLQTKFCTKITNKACTKITNRDFVQSFAKSLFVHFKTYSQKISKIKL